MRTLENKHVSIEDGLAAAAKADGATLLVVVGPKQAEKLLTALQVAEKMLAGDLDGCTALLLRYKELALS